MKCTMMISAPGKKRMCLSKLQALNHLILGVVWPKPGWTQVKRMIRSECSDKPRRSEMMGREQKLDPALPTTQSIDC